MATTWKPDTTTCKLADRVRCTGTIKGGKRKGERCTQPRVGGEHGTVCRLHGGAAPQVVNAAERRRQFAAAVELADTLGMPREIDPHAALLEEIYRTAGHVDWLEQLVHSLERGELKQYTYDDEGRQWEKPAIWYDLYERERKHLVTVCAKAIAAGVAERQVRLAEEQGSLIVKLLRGVLDDLGLADDPDARQVVARHLRLIDGGAAA
jgi:hypothetical protein